MKILNKIENLSVVIGTAIGLSNIESILGIIILAIQLIIILYKGGYVIYKKIKNKDFNIQEDLEKTVDDLKVLKDSVKDKKE